MSTEFVVTTIVEFDDGSVEAQELHRGSLESCNRVARRVPAIGYNGSKKPKGGASIQVGPADIWDALRR